MARGFGSTYGTGTDYITSAASFSVPSRISISFWTYLHGAGTFSFGNIFEAKNTAAQDFLVSLNGSATGWRMFAPWSTTVGTFTWTSGVSTGAWQHIAITYDGTSTSNKPTVYVNGSSVSVSVSSTPVGTYGMTVSNFRIGKTDDNSVQYDGNIAELAFWNTLLTASEASALARGMAPLFMRPAGLSYYWPLLGVGSGEPDWGPAHAAQTLTGTKLQSHAPVTFWMPPATVVPFSRYTGALALSQTASSAALALAEKFHAATAITQPNATASIGEAQKFRATAAAQQANALLTAAGLEKFSGHLAAAANANGASVHMLEILSYPGAVSIGDTAQGGLSALSDQPFYHVQITESV